MTKAIEVVQLWPLLEIELAASTVAFLTYRAVKSSLKGSASYETTSFRG